MKLAFIGIGRVGFALANNFQSQGHEIIIAHNDVESNTVLEAKEKNPNFIAMQIQEAIEKSDAVFLATPFPANKEILTPLRFAGKLLIDCTNPVGAGISHGLESNVSGAEKVEEWAGDASVVKSFSIYGFENLDNPAFPDYQVKPVMLIAGDDAGSKQIVTKLNKDLGFDTLDIGNLSRALHLEHMTLLWVNMVRAGGHHPHFTWAYLERSL